MTKIAASIGTIAVLLATAPSAYAPSAHAAAVPPQLHNKAISIAFSVTASAVAEDGTRANRPRNIQRTIYISSKGRIFSRSERQAGRNADTVESGPERTSGAFRYEGNRLIGVNVNFISGAGMLTVAFDSGFQSCTANVSMGREGGKAFKFKGLDGKTYTATGSPTASTPSCSIREGNPFAQ